MKRFALLPFAMLVFACDKPAAPPPPAPPVRAPVVAPPAAPAPPVVAAPEVDEAADEDLDTEAPEQDPASANVKLRIDVSPKSARPTVFWGKRKLGDSSVTIERPRRSGPVDIMITANGFLDYHTRLFTDRDDKLSIVMVRATEAGNMLGYKRKPDAGEPSGSVDAGAPHDARAPANTGPGFVMPQGVSF